MEHSSTSVLLELTAEDPVVVPPTLLQQAGFVAGDRLVLSVSAPGHLHLHKADVLSPDQPLPTLLQQLIQQAFRQGGYERREQVVALIREVRQELADER